MRKSKPESPLTETPEIARTRAITNRAHVIIVAQASGCLRTAAIGASEARTLLTNSPILSSDPAAVALEAAVTAILKARELLNIRNFQANRPDVIVTLDEIESNIEARLTNLEARLADLERPMRTRTRRMERRVIVAICIASLVGNLVSVLVRHAL